MVQTGLKGDSIMDPNACLIRILYHIRHGQTDDAAEAWLDLRDWINEGGFEPDYLQRIREFIDGRRI